MMIKHTIDRRLKQKKLDELIELPIIIRVDKFTPDAAKIFAEAVNTADNSESEIIPIVIDSFGGQVYALLAMIDVLRSAKKRVATVVVGKAMSCGAVLATCGSSGMRFVAPTATIMVHEVSSMSFGKVGEIKADTAETERLNAILFEMMAANCNQPQNYFTDIVHSKGHADWYITPKEAIKHRLADDIKIPQLTIDVSVITSFG